MTQHYQHLGFALQGEASPVLLRAADSLVAEVRKTCSATVIPKLACLDRLQQVYRPCLELTLRPVPFAKTVVLLPLDSPTLFASAVEAITAVLNSALEQA